MNEVVIVTRGEESNGGVATRQRSHAKRAALLLSFFVALVTLAVVLVGGYAGRALAASRNAKEPARIENEQLREEQRNLRGKADAIRSQLQAITDQCSQTTSTPATAGLAPRCEPSE